MTQTNKPQPDATPLNSASNGLDMQRRLELVRGDLVPPEAINWLWEDWLAVGKFHLLAGRAGTGKTTIALDMAAKISAGMPWPDGAPNQQGEALIWSGEDGIRDTITPRLIAAGADMTRIRFVRGVIDGHKRQPFDPAKDVPLLASRWPHYPARNY